MPPFWIRAHRLNVIRQFLALGVAVSLIMMIASLLVAQHRYR
jgi:hypothetical protein